MTSAIHSNNSKPQTALTSAELLSDKIIYLFMRCHGVCNDMQSTLENSGFFKTAVQVKHIVICQIGTRKKTFEIDMGSGKEKITVAIIKQPLTVAFRRITQWLSSQFEVLNQPAPVNVQRITDWLGAPVDVKAIAYCLGETGGACICESHKTSILYEFCIGENATIFFDSRGPLVMLKKHVKKLGDAPNSELIKEDPVSAKSRAENVQETLHSFLPKDLINIIDKYDNNPIETMDDFFHHTFLSAE